MLVVLNELMYTINTQYGGYSVWVGDEGRPGVQKVEQTFRKVRVEDKAAAVFSLQADTPTMRQRLLRTAATILDYFRAAGCQEGLLLIEAALASNGQLDGLDTFTGTTDQGAISAIVFGSWEVYQALKEKADLADLSAVLTFSTARARAGLYPALDPLKLTSTMLTEARVGKRHICLAKQTVELLKRYSVLDEVVTVEGIEALRGEDRQVAIRARRLDRFLTQPFFIAEAFSANPGKFLPLAQTLDGCEAIINGQYDNVLEEAFQFIGSVEEIGDGNSK
jgi:F-type H+-transporting ATPase subunit beta